MTSFAEWRRQRETTKPLQNPATLDEKMATLGVFLLSEGLRFHVWHVNASHHSVHVELEEFYNALNDYADKMMENGHANRIPVTASPDFNDWDPEFELEKVQERAKYVCDVVKKYDIHDRDKDNILGDCAEDLVNIYNKINNYK